MASGTIKGSFTGTATSNVYPEIRWRSTSNVTANTSSVTAELWFIKVSSYWYPYNLSGYSCGININGNNASTTATIDMRSVNSQRIWSRTVTVAHNADGAKSITISSGGNTGLNLGSVSVSGTAKLDSIPRASDFGTITGNQIGSAVTIAISRASGSFTHDVSMKLGGATVSTTGAGTSASLTPALSTFCGQLPKATSGSATITLTTKNGSTVVGTKTKTITLYVPTSVVPSISSFSVSEGGSGVSSAGLGANTFVQNKSRLDMTAYAIGVHGSTIVDYTFSYNGSSQGGTVGRQFMAGDTNGTKEVKVVVTDSRGRKAERKFDVTVLAYVAPRINKFVVYRVDNSNVVKADISYTVTNINSKGGQWYIDKLLGSTWTLTNSGTMTTTYSANGITVVGTYDVGKSFSFRTNLHDAFGFGATSLANISTAKTLLDLDKDIGIGVGKVHERGALDVGGNVNISGDAHSLTGVINLTPRPGGGTPVYTYMYRNSGEVLGALYHSIGDDAIGFNICSNGSYKTHKFGNDGTLNIGGQILENGIRVSTNSHGEDSVAFPDGNFGPYHTAYSSEQHPKVYHRNNSVITISGAITNKVVVPSGWSGTIASVPEWARPRNTVNFICQGSGNSTHLLTIASNGDVNMTRYRLGGNDQAVGVGSWINISCTYVIPL